jgi:hypothetical protein
MGLLRKKRLSSQLQPEYQVVRTIRSPDHVVKDAATGRWRISSGAYSPTDDGLVSIDLEQLLAQDNLNALFMYPALDRNVAATSHKVANLRALHLDAVHDPMPKNWYHGGISGISNKAIQRKLAKSALELSPIDQVEAQRLYDEVVTKRQRDVQG